MKSTVEAITVPAFVNGDISDGPSALQAMAESGADGVMVGRSLIGRPWALTPIMNAVDGTALPSELSPNEKARHALDHYDEILAFYPERKGIRVARKHLVGYADEAGLDSNDPRRQELARSDDPERVKTLLKGLFEMEKRSAA